MRKIWNFIISIPQDKLLHGIAGALINLYSLVIISRFQPVALAFLYAFMITLFALCGKELYDLIKKEGHSAEVWDILSGLIGVAIIDIALFIAFV